MANENTILTALGLDISQFEKGASQATSATKPLLGAIATIDSELRKLPILGAIYSATFGRIAEGFAETRLQARAFSQVMQTDVSGSLEGTLNQIDEINAQLKELKEGSFSRTAADVLTRFFNWGKIDKNPEIIRGKMEDELEKTKTAGINNIIGLLKQESAAHSAIVSGSELESEQARSYLEMRQKILNAVQLAQKIGGPDSAKWNDEIQKSVADQANLYVEIYNKQQSAAAARNLSRMEELKTTAKIADLQAHSNEREIADEEVKLALIKYENAEKVGVKEQIAEAQTELAIARAHSEQVQHQYELSIAQLHIETQLMAAQVSGQTRVAKQLEIQARYQIQISEELRRGNTARAQELAQQAKLAQLQEAIRQYELGGRGRAAERAGERHARRTARVVQSRLNERGLDQRIGNQTDGGLIGGGLRSGGLTTGSLARPIIRQQAPPTIPLNEVQTFMKGVLDALTK